MRALRNPSLVGSHRKRDPVLWQPPALVYSSRSTENSRPFREASKNYVFANGPSTVGPKVRPPGLPKDWITFPVAEFDHF